MPESSHESNAEGAWSRFLDELEADLDQAATLAAGDLVGCKARWTAPEDMPEVPEGLLSRIYRVMQRQTEVLEQLHKNRVTAQKHLQFVRADGAQGLLDGPRFFDQPV